MEGKGKEPRVGRGARFLPQSPTDHSFVNVSLIAPCSLRDTLIFQGACGRIRAFAIVYRTNYRAILISELERYPMTPVLHHRYTPGIIAII